MKYVITSIYLLIVLASCSDPKPIRTGKEGTAIPIFNLLLADSITSLNTKSIPVGKPIVLFYFSPQCPYCKAQMEEIIQNISYLRDIKFYIFTSWPYSEMKKFYEHFNLNKYPNLVTGIDQNNFFETYFKAFTVPYTAIYRQDKTLNGVFVGKVSSKQIKEMSEY